MSGSTLNSPDGLRHRLRKAYNPGHCAEPDRSVELGTRVESPLQHQAPLWPQ